MAEARLELRGIRKRFGSVDALRGADFVLRPGEVHGLLGENGAGKSTLMHVAFGLVRPDAGSVIVDGRARRIRSPLDAMALGLGMVHQHFASIATMTVGENLRLAAGRRRGRSGDASRSVAPASQERIRTALLAGVPVDAAVESLTVGAKQRLEIVQALETGAGVLLLDEPTAVLAPQETAQLLELLVEFAAAGGSVVLITHKLDEVLSAADHVTVLHRGETVLTAPRARVSRKEIAGAMFGAARAEPPPMSVAAARATAEIRIRAPGLEVRAGEIVGVAAVEGNGQRELLRRLVGLEAGEGAATPPVAFIPEDRSTEGLIGSFTLTENVVLGLPGDPRWSRGPWIRWRAAERRTAELVSEFGIAASGPAAPARTLSGGNQQKLVFARALESAPVSVVAENPTRGLDLAATAFVHQRLRELARTGAAVLVYSSDLDEVLALATRVVVMHRGVVRPAAPGASRQAIGAMMLGLPG
jgi:simple sugar transport system ATP-binding protein